MKILLLDIETAPNKAYVWGLFDQNIALNQLDASSYILCWSAKWLGEEAITFRKVQRRTQQREMRSMLLGMRALLNEADVVIHFNGSKFDIPTLQKEMLRLRIAPPAPFKQIDLYLVARKTFRFESNKLEYLLKVLDLSTKVKHEGFGLWVKCMDGDPEAWKTMEAYNRGDVVGLEELYLLIRPWIEKHPNWSGFKDGPCCPKCGGTRTTRQGIAVTTTFRYQRYQCRDCGGWFRGTKTISQRNRDRMTNIVS